MIFYASNIPSFKHITRNIHSSFTKDHSEKNYSPKNNLCLKPSKSSNLLKKSNNHSKSKIDSNSIDLEKSNDSNAFNQKSDNNNFSFKTGFSFSFYNKKIFKSIISKIGHLMDIHKYNKIKLYYILIKIENVINTFLKKNDSKKKQKKTNLYINKNKENSNISDNENLEEEKQDLELKVLKKRMNKLIQKQNEMENKFKFEKLSYLFFIGENQKKIKELTKKLSMESIDKIPKNELNKVICYPNYVKFDISDDINPKSIPMFSSNKKNYKSSKVISRNSPGKSDKDNSFNQLYKTELRQIKHNISFSINNNNNKKEEINKNNTLDYEKGKKERKISSKKIKLQDIDDILEIGKKSFEEHEPTTDLFKNKKKFFISHPKLNYINVENNLIRMKFGNQINSLPKHIVKLKTVTKSKKNAIIIFPSVLNETIVSIEKLKNNKNFRNIRVKFEEMNKIKLKSND